MRVDSRKGWWTPGEIVFTAAQMAWLISWLPVLEQGNWPPIPQGDSFARHTGKPRAPFETPSGVCGEVNFRLAQCGQDGVLLKDWYLWDKSDRDLVLCYQDSIESLIKRQKRALVFVSGFSRKPCKYEEWIRAGWRVPYYSRKWTVP